MQLKWLEDLLLGFNGSVLFIVHDQRFLDKLDTRIIELNRGILTDFVGNFTQYQVKIEVLISVEETHVAHVKSLLARLLEIESLQESLLASWKALTAR